MNSFAPGAAQPADIVPSVRLQGLIARLNELPRPLMARGVEQAIDASGVTIDDLRAFVTPTSVGYGRKRVLKREDYEILVMTWLPGQRTGPHDHGGCISTFKVLQGEALETRYRDCADSLVEPSIRRQMSAGDVGHDDTGVIHEIMNGSAEGTPLVSLHVYAPPLPELRRYRERPEPSVLHRAFTQPHHPGERVVVIIGGGFSGAMVAAQLARQSKGSTLPLNVIIIDRQASIAEGAAYRTPDATHVLNVAAQNMSAWPDRPTDFLDWCRKRDPQASPFAYEPRGLYGEYLRSAFFEATDQSEGRVRIDYQRMEATSIHRGSDGRWIVRVDDGRRILANTVVVATGHRPPDDPLERLWKGSRVRYVQDPWAALALTSIDPNERICLIGSALTAVDVLLTLAKQPRSAEVVALSRRGLVPHGHLPVPAKGIAPAWLDAQATTPLGIRALLRQIRSDMAAAAQSGQDWRQVIDGLRPHTARLWQRLPDAERARFLRHVRPFWEVARHRMAPQVAARVAELTEAGIFRIQAARLLSAEGSQDGVILQLQPRGSDQTSQARFDWVINCTGPGSVASHLLPPATAELVRDGWLERDALELGVRTAPDGRAIVKGRTVDDLYIIGSLRKPDLWETTAVPELRGQAAAVAKGIISR
jgi:uncharacterized NAD(P)/FAD-binding protein YdhS/mannose-6-phosphate isomerase-like protein (cupin superfamily)